LFLSFYYAARVGVEVDIAAEMNKLFFGFHPFSFKFPLKKWASAVVFGVEIARVAIGELTNKFRNTIVDNLF